ncbi:MAG: hypothetical protein IJU50_02275 [Lachnospiraceae bacterium]|nr:hypothetical protein [Lachnospiraceae bacterium]
MQGAQQNLSSDQNGAFSPTGNVGQNVQIPLTGQNNSFPPTGAQGSWPAQSEEWKRQTGQIWDRQPVETPSGGTGGKPEGQQGRTDGNAQPGQQNPAGRNNGQSGNSSSKGVFSGASFE